MLALNKGRLGLALASALYSAFSIHCPLEKAGDLVISYQLGAHSAKALIRLDGAASTMDATSRLLVLSCGGFMQTAVCRFHRMPTNTQPSNHTDSQRVVPTGVTHAKPNNSWRTLLYSLIIFSYANILESGRGRVLNKLMLSRCFAWCP